jgi:ABC-type nitrate/sulfonate/bicarbonate transport system ATPase subunit
MYDLLLRLWAEEEMTVFMVTHDLKEGFTLATRVLAFEGDGRPDRTRRLRRYHQLRPAA